MGSNMAEAHPVGFQWVMEAKARGARMVHIDPRFTRTSAMADQFVPLRAGSDIAFLGGMINYILSNEKDFREYVLAYTNASFLISEEYRDTEDLDGLFSGFDPATGKYDPSSWTYLSAEAPAAEHAHVAPQVEATPDTTAPAAPRSRTSPGASTPTARCRTPAASTRS